MLYRVSTGDEGTFGLLVTDSGYGCFIGELPWRDNKRWVSCIPAGGVVFERTRSPSRGWCYQARHVPGGRTKIQIHSANWMGDRSRGKRCQLAGCLAPGRAIGMLSGQRAVKSSRTALAGLVRAFWEEPFKLTIKWAFGSEED